MSADAGSSSWPLKPWQDRLILFCGPILLYASSLGFGLLGYDDKTYYLDNEALCGGRWQGLVEIWKASFYSDYFPVTQFTWWLDLRVAGAESWSFARLHGLVWFGIGVLGLHAICLRITNRRGLSFFVALLFALHPVSAPSVLWLAERKNQVCMAFCLWSFERYLSACQTEDSSHARRLFCAAWIFFALALLSKIHAVVLPVMFLSCELVLCTGSWRRRAMRIVPFMAAGAVFLAANMLWIRKDIVGDYLGGSRFSALVCDGPILLRYLKHTVAPVQLSFFYSVDEGGVSSPWAWAAWGAFVTAVFLLIRAAGVAQRRLALFGWLFGLSSISAAINIVPQLPMMDHYNHWALPGWLLAIALAVVACLERLNPVTARRRAVVLGVMMAVVFSVLSFLRVQEFSSPLNLFGLAAERQPGSALAWSELAQELRTQGRTAESGSAALKALSAPDAYRILRAPRSVLMVEAAVSLHESGQTAEGRALMTRETARLGESWASAAALANAEFCLRTGAATEARALLEQLFVGPLEDASRKLRERCRHGPELPHEVAPMVVVKFSEGDGYDRAFSRLVKVRSLNVLSQACLKLGERERGWDIAAVLVNLAPDYPAARVTLAEAYRLLGEPALAERTLSAAAK